MPDEESISKFEHQAFEYRHQLNTSVPTGTAPPKAAPHGRKIEMKDTKFLCIKPELGIDKNEFFQYIEV
jgi:hypothetical protein